MLLRWLSSRQANASYCRARTPNLISKLTRKYVSQSLSYLLWTSRSSLNTIVLGYSPCGNYLILFCNDSILFRSLRLTLRSVYATSTVRCLKIRHSYEIAMCNVAVVEVMFLRSKPLYITSTLTIPVEEFTTCNKVLCGRLKIFNGANLLYNNDNANCSPRNNAMFPFGDNPNDVLIILNCNASLCFYLIGVEEAEGYSSQSINSFESVMNSDASIIIDTSNTWYTQNIFNETSNMPRIVLQSSFDIESFVDEYLSMLHPKDYQKGSQIETEFRIIGPCDSGIEYLAVLGVSFTHLRAGLQYIGLITIVSPFVNKIAILSVCDIAALSSREMQQFNLFSDKLRRTRRGENPSWLSTAIDFYDTIVRNAYNQSLYGCSTTSSNVKRLIPYCVLSNINMVVNGESLSELVHPFIPVVVINDENTSSVDTEEFEAFA